MATRGWRKKYHSFKVLKLYTVWMFNVACVFFFRWIDIRVYCTQYIWKLCDAIKKNLCLISLSPSRSFGAVCGSGLTAEVTSKLWAVEQRSLTVTSQPLKPQCSGKKHPEAKNWRTAKEELRGSFMVLDSISFSFVCVPNTHFNMTWQEMRL